MYKQFYSKQPSLALVHSLNVKQFLLPIDRTLSGAIAPGQSGSGSDGNKGILRIPQSSSITEASPSDCLVLSPGHSFGRALPLCIKADGVLYCPCWLGQSKEVVLSKLLNRFLSLTCNDLLRSFSWIFLGWKLWFQIGWYLCYFINNDFNYHTSIKTITNYHFFFQFEK